MMCTDIMKDQSEVVHYTLEVLPVYISTAALSEYPNMRALCHWHEDIELIRMEQGDMNYYVNGNKVLLKENDCLMINTRQMHYGYSFYGRDCRFTCILFHPGMLGVSDGLYKKYVLPVLENTNLEYLHFKGVSGEAGGRAGNEGAVGKLGNVCQASAGREEEEGNACKASVTRQEAEGNVCGTSVRRKEAEGNACKASAGRAGMEVAALLDQIVWRKEAGDNGFEMEIAGLLYRLWNRIAGDARLLPSESAVKPSSDLTVQKDMVAYIYQRYREKLTLADIAASGHVCRSKCCEIFKRYLQQSPIDFLNSYRLKVSCDKLADTQESITQIAFSCGFNHLSYFSQLFYRRFGCTPSDYRKSRCVSRRDERSRPCAEDII